MTATDELRALLDGRGVEHYDGTETTLWGYEPTGESVGVYRYAADETANGRMQVRMFHITPAKAIDATLGRGEIDLPDIVWCKDCRFMHTVRSWLGVDVDECWLHADQETGALGKNRTEPNGFCAWGERRESK